MTIIIRFFSFLDSSSSLVHEKESDLTLTSSVPTIEFNKNVADDDKEDNTNESDRDKDETVQKSRWVKTS